MMAATLAIWLVSSPCCVQFQKKKSKSKSVRIVTDEDVAGPLHPAEETEPEISTRSLSLGELRDLRREFTHQTNASILTWLFRIWDAAANDTILDGSEARQLGVTVLGCGTILCLTIWPVRKSSGEWRLTVDFCGLNEVMPPLSAAVPDMLELQVQGQFAFTWKGVQYTWNRLPQWWKHSPTICHGLIQTALEKGEAPEHLQYIDDIIVWGNTTGEVFEKGEKIIQILLKLVLP
ncbi:hypothetical protein DUI87_01085 [Hirundo rustica rustica]|uniref:Reverse transcriptase domain-containing protein n=1 Tax=Hirundo rustica rustica TaxID=333673 RepID=A0A3M0L3X0_HIRRU|nr:hypothetical protein DUI87_01085 [Hirundo rustica rustica]